MALRTLLAGEKLRVTVLVDLDEVRRGIRLRRPLEERHARLGRAVGRERRDHLRRDLVDEPRRALRQRVAAAVDRLDAPVQRSFRIGLAERRVGRLVDRCRVEDRGEVGRERDLDLVGPRLLVNGHPEGLVRVEEVGPGERHLVGNRCRVGRRRQLHRGRDLLEGRRVVVGEVVRRIGTAPGATDVHARPDEPEEALAGLAVDVRLPRRQDACTPSRTSGSGS